MWTGDYEFESRNGNCDTTLDIHNTLPKAKKKKRYLEIEDMSQISQCKWPGHWNGGKWRPKTIVTQMYYILPRELYLEIISKYVPCTVCQQHVCQQLLFYPWGSLEGLKSKLLLTNSFDPTGLLPRGRFLLSDVRYKFRTLFSVATMHLYHKLLARSQWAETSSFPTTYQPSEIWPSVWLH